MTAEKLSLEGLIFEAVEIDIKDHILTIRLNRPERKNAINAAMAAEIIYALDYAKQERDIRVVVLAANGDVFCAGGDLSMMSGKASETTSTVPVRGGTDDIALRIRHLNKPSIACVQGNLFAGALLFLCNVTHAIAAEGVKFSAPEIKRGIWPFMVMGGLFRVMPQRAALDFVMRGNAISTDKAEKWGLINEAVPADSLQDHVASLATELASLAPGSMSMGLAAYVQQDAMDFDSALPFLREQLDACLQSPDAKEGITAFLEKRAPKWE
ncbi:enoyl-CoA hydratase/isomerase family protein [Pseudomaricurvus alkylphenolicus]|uniref:enoyl-CoA hydratase/isomerase family protein n=1 Tax=Pseudomaricurvus alkylphenolicus TaxID=1306991 RepID=UPI00141F4B85|nr:enoyl-CoA hydratase/isomerase family protein [Pseudomaricurvus alkylphenolicus]NIB42217.1 enoyl-CoA hydratase/isomerase family protein [Pseudomaricurvus alkylphenolicus]